MIRKHHILLIESQRIMSRLINEYLRQEGFQVHSFSNGREAFSLLMGEGDVSLGFKPEDEKRTSFQIEKKIDENNPESLLSFDLIILNMMLPDIDGFELCRIIRQNFSIVELPILFLSARDETIDIIKGLESGANDYLLKPFDKSELITRSKTLIRLKELNDSNKVMQEALALKNRILQIIAHDLRNPLTTIIGLSSILKQDLLNNNEHSSMMDFILNSSDRMLNIVSELLESSRIDSGKITITKEPVDLNIVAKSVFECYIKAAGNKKQKLIFIPSTNITPLVNGDTVKLQQIIDNLISNSVKYTLPGKEIHVEIKVIDSGINQKYVILSVIDQGLGLSEKDMKKLFGKFQRLTPKPTGNEHSIGLGLSIVKELTELHGGKIHVESTLGEGSTFSIILPLEQ